MLDTDGRQIPLEFLKVGMLKCSCISLEYSLWFEYANKTWVEWINVDYVQWGEAINVSSESWATPATLRVDKND